MAQRHRENQGKMVVRPFVVAHSIGVTTAELFTYLLSHGEECRLDLFSVRKFIGKSTTEGEALAFITSYPKEFEIKKVDGKQFIEAKTSVKLCDAFQEGKCGIPSCEQLHICRFFLRDGCKFDEKCKKTHSFDSPETKELLRRHELDYLRPNELRNLFKKVLNEKRIKHTSESSAPKLCKFYNKGICKNGDKCDFLHVCEHYVEGDCKFGRTCKRLHNFDTLHSKRILAYHSLGGLRVESQILLFLSCGSNDLSSNLDHDYSSLLQNMSSCQVRPTSSGDSGPRHASGSSTPESDHEKLEICGFNLRGKCQYGAMCNARHTILPYEWQYVLAIGSPLVWTSFTSEENSKIEKEFCNFNVGHARATLNEGHILYPIDFQTMTGKIIGIEIKIRRLSTVSSVLAASGHVFRTKWKWYWLDEHKNWQSYDDGKANTTSEEIEEDYQSESAEKKHNFSTDSHKYSLFFDNPNQLYQQNNKIGTKRDVRRRPAQFLDEGKMKTILEEFKKQHQRTSNTGESQYPVPAHWAPIDTSDKFKVVNLSEDIDKEEFTKVKTQFLATMPAGFQIKSIKRVQNVGLWEDYERQKSKIKKSNSGNLPEERWLFHGTNNDTVDPICQQGFDWRLSGKHGTRYGKGCYFASEAAYSHSYSKSSDPRMFMANVIVGSYVLGAYDTQRPPPKDLSNPLSILHDSCVNDVSKPTIFVVFERSQAYPYYIIEYMETQCAIV